MNRKRSMVSLSADIGRRLSVYAAEKEMTKMAVADIALMNFLDKKDAIKARAEKRKAARGEG